MINPDTYNISTKVNTHNPDTYNINTKVNTHNPDTYNINTKANTHNNSITVFHWMPIAHRVYFKILSLTFKAVQGQAPEYLAELVMQVMSLQEHYCLSHKIY